VRLRDRSGMGIEVAMRAHNCAITAQRITLPMTTPQSTPQSLTPSCEHNRGQHHRGPPLSCQLLSSHPECTFSVYLFSNVYGQTSPRLRQQ